VDCPDGRIPIALSLSLSPRVQAVELAFQKDRMMKEAAEAVRLGEKVDELNDRLARTTIDSDDILTHKQREIKLKLERVHRLEVRRPWLWPHHSR
jgi:hypothetical protein